MTAATVVLCRCGHAERRHSDDDGCSNSECGCAEFRPGDPTRVQPTPIPAAASQPSRGVAAVPARPAAPFTLTRPAAPPPGPTADQIIAAGKRSPVKATVALAERIVGQLITLRDRIHAERELTEQQQRQSAEREHARLRIAELEKQLATERAKLQTGKTRAERKREVARPGQYPCPDCDRTFEAPQGVGPHRRKVHGHTRFGASA